MGGRHDGGNRFEAPGRVLQPMGEMGLFVVDDMQRTLRFGRVPERIVSLVPSVTDLLCTLGVGNHLVGVTCYCSVPGDLLSHCVRVGGTKDPDCERVLDLRPDVVFVSPEENRRADFDRLQRAGVHIFVVAATSVADVAASVRRIGRMLNTGESAGLLADTILSLRTRAMEGVRRRWSVFCPIWRDPWMSFNRSTYAHDLLSCVGGDNICGDASASYGPVDLACVARRAPEIILLPDEPYPFSTDDLYALSPMFDTPAWKNGRVYFVSGRDLFWYGAQTAAALETLRSQLR